MTNGFPSDAIFLRCEHESAKGCRVQVGKGAVRKGELAATNPQANILKAKEIIGGRAGAASIFARTEEKIKGNSEAIRCSQRHRSGSCMREAHGPPHNAQGQWFNASGRCVCLSPGLVEGGQSKINNTKLIQARVRGPHPGKRLAHTAYGVLHRPSANESPAGGKAAVPVTVGKELQ